jgi:hypothetical protein
MRQPETANDTAVEQSGRTMFFSRALSFENFPIKNKDLQSVARH